MRYVATLVAADRLAEDLISAAASELRNGSPNGGSPNGTDPDWLAPGKACDLQLEVADPETARAILARSVEGHGVDFAVQEREGRRKRLLVADMESTMIRNEMIDELAELAGIRSRVEAVTEQAMNGEIDFDGALRVRVELLVGLPVTALEQAGERLEIEAGARELVATMRRHGAMTALVTGGFGCFADKVRAELGLDRQHSNELMVTDGRICGRLREPILDGDAKLSILLTLCAELGIPPEQAAAVGDGANDLPMLAAAGLGVAFHGKPIVAAAASFRVDHGDLKALLYFQGYREDEIVRQP